MERHSTGDDRSTVGDRRHVGVQLLVTQPEEDGLVSHQPAIISVGFRRGLREISIRLVVTLGISDGLLAVAAVGQCPADVGDIPILILLLLQELDPHVGDSHRQTVIKPDTTERKWEAECRHARHILCNCDAVGKDVVEHLVSLWNDVSNGFVTRSSEGDIYIYIYAPA